MLGGMKITDLKKLDQNAKMGMGVDLDVSKHQPLERNGSPNTMLMNLISLITDHAKSNNNPLSASILNM